MLPQLRLELLGPFQATLDGQTVQGFISNKVQALLAYLAMAGCPCQRVELTALLWGDMPETNAQANLRQALSNLRKLLGPYLHIDRQIAALAPESKHWVDAFAFQQEALNLLRRIEAAPVSVDDAALASLQTCAAWYAGDFLSGFQVRASPAFEDWMLLQRERLHKLAGQVLHQLTAQLAARRRYVEAINVSTRWLELDPWNEDAHRQHMLLLASDGQRSAALRQYEICRRILQAEIGVQPSPETQALYRRLAANAPLPGQNGAAFDPGAYRLPFVARESEHAWLLQRWQASRRWQGGLTLVSGEAGIGKTRLVQQVLEQVALQGGVVLQGRCYEFNRAHPFQAIHDAMQNYLSSLPPAKCLTLTNDLLIDMERLLAAGRQTWPNGVTLFLDDLQWADPDTLDVLHYLARRLAHGPCWFVGAYRPEETPSAHPLARLMRSLDNDGLLFSLSLQPLSEPAVAHLVELLAAADPASAGWPQAQLAQTLYTESQGSPFLLNELVSRLQENHLVYLAGENLQGLHLSGLLSERGQMLIRRRVESLNETSQYLLSLAAAFGQPFDAALLQAAGDCSPQVVDQAVQGWLDGRLVKSTGRALDFTHDKIRSFLVQGVPAPLRRLLHARLAAAIEALYAGPQAPLDLLAHHFDQAQNWFKALHYLKLAGDAAARQYACEQAHTYYSRALDILRQHLPTNDAAAGQEFELLCGLETLYEIQGRRSEQNAVLGNLAKLAGLDLHTAPGTAADAPRQVEVRLRQARYAEATGDYVSAAQAAQSAVILAETAQKPVLAAAGYHQWAYALRRQKQLAAARELYHKAYQVAVEFDAQTVVCDCLQGLANIARDRQEFEQAQVYIEQSLVLCRSAGDLRSEGDAYNILGLVMQQQGNYLLAREHFEKSLLLRRQIGDRRGVSLVLNNLGRLAIALDDFARAKASFLDALGLSEIVGDQLGQAVAHAGLFQVYQAQHDHEQAQKHAWQSLRFYRRIGDHTRAREIIAQLKHVNA